MSECLMATNLISYYYILIEYAIIYEFFFIFSLKLNIAYEVDFYSPYLYLKKSSKTQEIVIHSELEVCENDVPTTVMLCVYIYMNYLS
jgi:hypothetical protein